VVIGGGPGGSTAATLLAQMGYDVVVIDKEKHPRFTVGESIIPHFWKYAQYTGAAQKLLDEDFIVKAGGTVVWDGVIRQMRFRDFGYDMPALHVERDRFDLILLDHARSCGARVFEETSVTTVDFAYPEMSTVNYRVNNREPGSIKAKFIVDASGQSALVARQLGLRKIDEGFRFMSLWGYFEDSLYVAADGNAYPFSELRRTPPTTFVTNVHDWNWVWHIPLRESTSVGITIAHHDMQGIRGTEQLERHFLQLCEQIPNLNRLLEDARFIEGSFHVIRDYSYLPTALCGPGFFLVGDAAAFVDPIFSIGVVLAMYSGYLASWAIDRSLRHPESASRNEAIYQGQLGTRMEASRALALPLYGADGKSQQMTEYMFKFETSLEQELMYVVSTLTTRSPNFVRMARGTDQLITSDKYRTIERIGFDYVTA
jgi:flavin-dependent dehydrogenase